jgi:hypothetical protein
MDYEKLADRVKWLSTASVLIGILLTNLNIYPLNLAFHAVGVLVWTWVGYVKRDGAIMTNFGLQIPLFAIGAANLVLS